MKPSVIVWDLETVPDLGGFAGKTDSTKACLNRLVQEMGEG
jgi:hypothetical protein